MNKLFSPLTLLLALLTTSFILRILLRTVWLEDWDSVQFALSLHDFSLKDHQPHAPGYPLYVLIGKLFYLFLQNDTLALTTVSAVFGSLSLLPIYFLTKKMFDTTTALLASLIFIFTPVEWILSEVALTNITGLFFLLVVAYMGYKSLVNTKLFTWVCFLSGLILGVRFTELPVIATLLGFLFFKQRQQQNIFKCFGSFLIGVLSWMIPMIFVVGWKEFIDSYTWIATYILQHDSLLGQEISWFSAFGQRLQQFWYIASVGYTPYFLILGLVSLIWALSRAIIQNNTNYQFLIVFFLSYALPLIFMYNLEVTRYTLPLLPPLAISTASFFRMYIKQNVFTTVIVVIFMLILSYTSWSYVNKLSRLLPPTIESVLHTKKVFSPSDTKVITTFTYRQFQYYAPEFKPEYGVNTDELSLKKNIIIDYLGLKESITGLENFTINSSVDFSSDQDVFQRIPKVTLYVLKNEKLSE